MPKPLQWKYSSPGYHRDMAKKEEAALAVARSAVLYVGSYKVEEAFLIPGTTCSRIGHRM
jgi:hypothetical protein